MDAVWEDLHSTRSWGKYPAEDLIRRVMRAHRDVETRQSTKVLELGCGAGANLSFFLQEGFQVVGIDGAPSAIEAAKERLKPFKSENQLLELETCYFEDIDYPDASFDLIVDYFAIYANRMSVIDDILESAKAMLKPGGRFYSRCWGTKCEGFETGKILEPGTSENPTCGPCANMGTSHFFSLEELQDKYADWSSVEIFQTISREATNDDQVIEEFTVWAVK